MSIIIPVLNERRSLPVLAAALESLDLAPLAKELIFVDDGSTDGSRQWLMALSGTHTVLYHRINEGKGRAVRTGLSEAGGEFTLICDADLELDPGDITHLLAKAGDGCPVVFGSRRLAEPWPPRWWRQPWFFVGGLVVRALGNLLYGLHLTDLPCGYKLLRTALFRSLDLASRGFEIDAEITAKLARRRVPIAEVPVRYAARTRRGGKKLRVRDEVKLAWTLCRLRVGLSPPS